jgi:hypothetical protein
MINLKQMPTERLPETSAAQSCNLAHGRTFPVIGQRTWPHTDWAKRWFRGVLFFVLAVAGLLLSVWPPASHSQAVTAEISVTLAPPPLPVYTQPPLPLDGDLWMPGYWAYGIEGYYWVPGVWVAPPAIGLLWTPGYWDWNGGIFVWRAGYWGPHVGFYGGVNYGFGYVGTGYAGGYWQNGALFYNRTVVNIGSARVVNIYRQPVPSVSVVATASFHGGQGGTTARPTAAEQAAARESHQPPTAGQVQQEKWAGTQRDLLTSVNHGKPAITSTQKPAQRPDSSVVGERTAAQNKIVAPRPADSRAGSTAASARTGPDQIKSAPAIKLHDVPAQQREQPPPVQEQKPMVEQAPRKEQSPENARSSRPPAQEQKPTVEQAPKKEQSPENARSSRPQARPEERRESSDERPNSG